MTDSGLSPAPPLARLGDPGSSADLVRQHPWSDTPLGPIERWSHALTTVANLVLASTFPAALLWGDQQLALYNDAFSPLLGTRHPAALGRPLKDTWPEIWPILGIHLHAAFHHGTTVHHPKLLIPTPSDGAPQELYWDLSITPVFDDGHIVGTYLLARNITDAALRLEALAEIRAEQERFKALSDHNPVGVFQADLLGTVTYVNARTQQMFGLTEQEILGSGWLSRVHPEDLPGLLAGWTEANRQGLYFEHMYRVINPHNDHVQYILGRSAVLHTPAGLPGGVVGTVEDVTERRLAHEVIEESRARLDAIYTTSLAYIGLLSPQGILLDTNQASLTFAGSRREDVIGAPFWDSPWFAFTPGAPQAVKAAIRHVATGAQFQQQLSLQRPTGELVIFDFSLKPVLDSAGNVLYIVPEGHDITLLKQAEAALRQNEKLAAVGRLAASIAHEINNPLESVTNLLYLARNSSSHDDIQGYLEIAERELRRVSIISNQTLRFHRQSTAPRSVSSDDLFDSVLSIYQGRLINSSVTVLRRRREQQPVSCFDGEIRQVLNNLVGNAIDSIPPTGGSLRLRSRQATHWPTGARGLVLTIADTGSGMAPHTQDRVYEAFFTTKGIGGSGLGLWISAEIVARHQGSLRLRSSLSRGTVFTLFLPFTLPG